MTGCSMDLDGFLKCRGSPKYLYGNWEMLKLALERN
jgi:hypothetical protein